MFSGRRRVQFVDKNLQYRFAMICLAYTLVFASILGMALFLPPLLYFQSDEFFVEETLNAVEQLPYFNANFLLLVAVSLIAIGLHAIRTSHKIAGPLYRHKRIFRAIKEGRIPRSMSPRQGDYLLEETTAVNEMLDGLRSRLNEFRETQEQINDSIQEIPGLAEKGRKEEISKRVAEVTERSQGIVDRLNRFLVES
jgi:methyl-accepting chemotaxis protein